MRAKPLVTFVILFALLPACNLFGVYQPEPSSLSTTVEITFKGVSPDAEPGYEQIEAKTRDSEVIYLDITLLFGIDPSKMLQIQEEGGSNYPIVLLKPIIQSVIQDVTAKYSVRELVNNEKRKEWIEKLRQEIKQRITTKGFLYSDFLIRNIQFSKEFTAIIEQELIMTLTLEAEQRITPTP